MRRADDFNAAAKNLIAKRAGYRCSSPSCRASTIAAATDPGETASVGVAAHITAASVNGPRYDARLTHDERSSAANGIWLCQTHARLIDVDVDGHSVELLRAWKDKADETARRELGRPVPDLLRSEASPPEDWRPSGRLVHERDVADAPIQLVLGEDMGLTEGTTEARLIVAEALLLTEPPGGEARDVAVSVEVEDYSELRDELETLTRRSRADLSREDRDRRARLGEWMRGTWTFNPEEAAIQLLNVLTQPPLSAYVSQYPNLAGHALDHGLRRLRRFPMRENQDDILMDVFQADPERDGGWDVFKLWVPRDEARKDHVIESMNFRDLTLATLPASVFYGIGVGALASFLTQQLMFERPSEARYRRLTSVGSWSVAIA